MRRDARSSPVSAASLAEAAVWALLVVVPLLFDPVADEAFRLPKRLAGEWLGLLSLVFLAWRLRGAGIPAPAALWRLPALRAVLPVLAVATLGLATTFHPLQVRGALADLWIGAACLVGWSLGFPRERLERLLAGLLWPGAALALFAVLQFHGIWEPLRFAGIQHDPRLGLTSLAGNPGDLAAFLVLPCLVGQWRLARGRRGPARAAVAAGLALCLYALAFTQTLAALAALAAGSLVFWAVRLAPRGQGLGVPARRLLAGLAAGAVLAAALLAGVAPLRARVAEKLAQLAAGDWNALLTGRLDGWRAAVWMFGRRPFAGVGQGAYRSEFALAKLSLLDRGVPFYAGQLQPVFGNAHNEFLEAAAEWGLPGIAALAWGIWVLVAAVRRAAPAGSADAALAWGALAALAVLALAYFPFHVALVAFPAVLYLAWVLHGEEAE